MNDLKSTRMICNDCDELETLETHTTLYDQLCRQDLHDRHLYLDCDVEIDSVGDIIRSIMRYNTEDKGTPVEERKPIFLYIASDGGDVDAGFALIDIIMNSVTPVYTVNMGYWYSMGFLIGLSGAKRFATQNAKFLHHDGISMMVNSGNKLRDQMEFERRVEKRIKDYVLARTVITEKEYNKHSREEWYMYTEDAKALGIIDTVIGVDCGLDEIL